jgi:hypothetical protein
MRAAIVASESGRVFEDEGRASTCKGGKLRATLVIVEVALAVVLLVTPV